MSAVVADGLVGYLYVNTSGSVSAWASTSGQYTGQVCFPSSL